MTEKEKEIHLKLSEIVIDNDNLDYIKAQGEICGKLRDDLVKMFSEPETDEVLPQSLKIKLSKIKNLGFSLSINNYPTKSDVNIPKFDISINKSLNYREIEMEIDNIFKKYNDSIYTIEYFNLIEKL